MTNHIPLDPNKKPSLPQTPPNQPSSGAPQPSSDKPSLPPQTQSSPSSPAQTPPPPPYAPQTPTVPPKTTPPAKKIKWQRILFWGALICIVLLGIGFLYRLPVKIKITPSAKLIVDGEEKGEISQTTLWLRPGKHSLRAEKIGYRPYSATIKQPWFGLVNLSFSLQKAPSLSKIDQGTFGFMLKRAGKTTFLYFNPNKKAFFKYDPETGQKQQITPGYFWNLQKVKWSESGQGVVVWLKYDKDKLRNTPFYRDDLKNEDSAVYYYDFKRYTITDQSAYYWGKDINEIAWAPVRGRFYYLGGKPDQGYLARAENNASNVTRLLTHIPATGQLKINSTETFAYLIGRPFNTTLARIDLTDPARELEALTQEGRTGFVWVNDDWVLVGSLQGNPQFKSTEKYQLFSLKERKFVGSEIYAQKGWFYQIKNTNFVVLEAKQNLWKIRYLNILDNNEYWGYEYLNTQTPSQIWYDSTNNLLFLEIKGQLFTLKIDHA